MSTKKILSTSSSNPYALLPEPSNEGNAKHKRDEDDGDSVGLQPDGNTSNTPKKVKISAEPDKVVPQETSNKSPNTSDTAPDSEEDKLKLILEKISKVIVKDAKFGKAMKMLAVTLQKSLDENTAELFMTALKASQQKSERVHDKLFRKAFGDLFGLVQDKIECFPQSCRFQIDTMMFNAITHNALFTDDSFKFSKATKAVRTNLEELNQGFSTDIPVEAGIERQRAILDSLHTVLEYGKYKWAKTDVDVTLKMAADYRLKFDAGLRDELDEINIQLKARRNSKVVSEKKGGWASYST